MADFGQTYVFGQGTVSRLDSGRLTAVWSGARVPSAPDSSQTAAYTLRAALALRRPGEVVVAQSECWFRGVLVADVSGPRPVASLLAGSDYRTLLGPTYPRRVAAGSSIWVMQGDYWDATSSSPPLMSAHFGLQGVQRWTPDGKLVGQHNFCDVGAGIDTTVDATLDGTDLYVVTRSTISLYGSNLPPDWRSSPSDAIFRAADAGDGQVAMIDAASQEVIVRDRSGRIVVQRSYAVPPLAVIPVDVALAGDSLWLADAGAQALVGTELTTSLVRRIELPDAPRAVADGPDGSLFVLGSREWVYRYAPDGTRLAAWRLPLDAIVPRRRGADAMDTLDVSDIAVGPNGRVYIPFTHIGAAADAPLLKAGIWVFWPGEGADEAPPDGPPSTTACIAVPEKRAAPAQLWLGEAVTVTLRVDGRCPGMAEPHQVVFVVDTSGSMDVVSLGRAKETVVTLIEALNSSTGQAAVVRFADEGIVAAPLTNRLSELRATVLQLPSGGATHYVAGIEAAVRELTGPRGNPSARRTIVLVTDGIPDDDPKAAIDAARAAGLGVIGLIFPSRVPQEELEPVLRSLLGDAPFHFDLRPDEIGPVVDRLREWREPPNLFERIEIVDEIPANMRLDVTSVVPAAVQSGRTLTWSLGAVAAGEGVTLRYRLVPLALGRHPTNARAAADYRDALGNDARLFFPVPYVDVAARPTETPTPTATTTPTPTATPSRTVIHLPIAIREETVKRTRRTDIVLVIDASQSMSGAKLDAAKAAAGAFIAALPVPANRIGLVTFNDIVVDALPPTEDVAAVRRRIDGLATRPGTRIDRALAAAQALLASVRATSDREPVVLLLTDGRQTDEPASAVAAAVQLRGAGAELWAIGLGGDVDAAYLAELTAAPERVRLAARPSDLVEVYEAIARLLPCRAEDYWSRRCG